MPKGAVDSVPTMVAKLLVVGGGKMGAALVEGLLASGWAGPPDLTVVEALPARRGQLTARDGLATRFSGLQVVADAVPAEGAVVAVKPGDVEMACRALGPAGVGRVLSVAAGVKLSDLTRWCGEKTAILRAMPNTAALVGEAATALAVGPGALREDIAWATGIMQAVGKVVEVPERWMDAVTGLSGSGPAYLFLVVEAMVDAGVLVGLPREVASELASQTLVGAARLLAVTGEAPEALRAAVTSPGGTTAAGLRQLESRAVRSAFVEAVAAATQRAAELAG